MSATRDSCSYHAESDFDEAADSVDLHEPCISKENHKPCTRYACFRNVVLLASRETELQNDHSQINRLLFECTRGNVVEARAIDVVIPGFKMGLMSFADSSSAESITQQPLSHVVYFTKGTSLQTNRLVLLAVRDAQPRETHPTVGPSSDSPPSAPTSDLSTSVSTTIPTLTNEAGLYTTYVIQLRSTYEASRLLEFIRKVQSDTTNNGTRLIAAESGTLRIRMLLDLREEDKSNENEWKSVPKEKSDVFKLRQKTAKRFVIGFQQYSGVNQVSIDSCLDISVTYGRYLKDSELNWLGPGEVELFGEEASNVLPGSSLVTYIRWPEERAEFQAFERITGKDECLFFTVAVRLKMRNVDNVVFVHRICRARVFRHDESFWIVTDRKPVSLDFTVNLSEVVDSDGRLLVGSFSYGTVISPAVDTSLSANGDASTMPNSSGPSAVEGDEDEAEDESEPLASGHGVVSQDLSDEQALNEWGLVIREWQAKVKLNACSVSRSNGSTLEETGSNRLLSGTVGPQLSVFGSAFSRHVRRLVNRGVPDALRAEVWQLLSSGASMETDLMNVYRILITKPCKHDAVIQRDLSRTFPAHQFFREQVGQEYLFQVSRAYALYDEEVGYCQSLSFFAAVLLLHMPVEQAFSLMVQVNNHYGIRELFLYEFDGLHMRLYQLQRLIQDRLPDVYKHFVELNVETHMYASQWFLTLFTAKFPLQLVYRIIDQFLAEGMIFIFKVSLALLHLARRDLLGLNFEGVLKYLRVSLPKRFIDSTAGDELLAVANASKITSSRMLKYAKEWRSMKTAEDTLNSPVSALEQQVATLRNQISRLEHENEVLATRLLSSNTSMHSQVDKLEDKAEVLTRELFVSRQDLQDALEEKTHLESEVAQIKQMLRTQLAQVTRDQTQQQNLIAAYRLIVSDLSRRVGKASTCDPQQSTSSNTPVAAENEVALCLRLLWVLMQQVSVCDNCSPVLQATVTEWKTDFDTSDDVESSSLVDGFLSELHLPKGEESAEGHQANEPQRGTSLEAPVSAKLTNLKAKQWFSSTLQALRAMTSVDSADQPENGPPIIPAAPILKRSSS